MGGCTNCLCQSDFVKRLKSLRHAPRELWIVYFLKFLESYAYFSMSVNFTIYLSEEFGYDDVQAGTFYGLWGVLTSVYGVLAGPLIDRLGVKWSLVVGGLLGTVGRFLFAIAWARWVVLLSFLVIMPAAMSLGVPVLSIGIKRYTNENNRSLAFGLFYSFMNVAAVFSGPVTDLFVHLFDEGVNVGQWHAGSLRLVFLTGVVASLFYAIIPMLPVFREIDVNAKGTTQRVKTQKRGTWASIKYTVTDKIFYRLMLFSFLLVGVRFIFRHLDATFPKYAKRALGPDTPYGSLYSINPFLIIFLVPPLSTVLAKYDPYRCITIGSFISALSVFALCIGAEYWTSVLFVVILSIGEAVYSPRVYEYTLLLAPKGYEGIYSQLATAPMFVTKLIVGVLSGVLLEHYCPEVEPRNCEMMWLIIGLMSISSPVLMLMFQRCIHTQDVKQRIVDADKVTTTDGLLIDQDDDDEEQANGTQLRAQNSGQPEQVDHIDDVNDEQPFIVHYSRLPPKRGTFVIE